ncbi:MAG: hypothetical protein Q9165_006522 [Trypethelium subeluteriae]
MPSSPQPQRPSSVTRNSSASLQQLRSPSTGQTPPTRSAHHKPQRHVVGHGSARIGPRNPSFGKNINKLAKLTPIDAGEEKDTPRHHKRSLSGNATPSSSPRQGHVKRNASALAVAQEARAQVAAQMRKNNSSGQLQRGGSSKALAKQMKQDGRVGMKRSASSQGKVQQQAKSPKSPKHPSVRFAFGNDEEQDDGWTEDSASQSPSTTRDTTRNNTRNNSMVLESGKTENQPPDQTEAAAQQRPRISQYPDGHANGLIQHRTSRPPDADAITSRLLQRHPSNNAPPQTSKVSAVGQTNDSSSPQTISQSQGSTIAGTPGSHLVSRFINGDTSTTGTPVRDSQTSLLQRLRSSPPSASSLSKHARNKSTPNLSPAQTTSATSTPPHHQQQPPTSSDSQSQTPTGGSSGGGGGSGSTTAAGAAGTTTTASTPLPSSRTQQKLWLQRASTTAEPNSLVPATLPRTGTGPAAALAGLGGGLPPFGVGHLQHHHHHSHHPHHHHQPHHSHHHSRHHSRSSAEGVAVEDAGSAAGSAGTSGGGGGEEAGAPRVDPRLQRLFDTAEGQYRAVRRFRDPVGEAVGRVRGARARARKEKERERDKERERGKGKGKDKGRGAQGKAVGMAEGGGKKGGGGRQAGEDAGEGAGSVDRRRRPKVSFEGVKASGVDDEEDGGVTRPASRDSDVEEGRGGRERGRDDVQEICRRMWGMLDGGVED